MAQSASVLSLFFRVYTAAADSFRKNPRIYLPFLIFAFIESVALTVLFLIPREPLREVLGPVIRGLWGEQYLHYPQNFLLLPKLAFLSKMSLSVLVGSLTTAAAVAFLYQKTFKQVLVKYAHLLIIVFCMTFSYYALNKVVYVSLVKYFMAGHANLLFISAKWWVGPIYMTLSQILAIFLQALFVYAIPAVILSDKKFYSAIGVSAMTFFTNFRLTILLVTVPVLLTIPLIFLFYNSAFLMRALFPEFILILVFLGIVVNSLVVDPVMTLTTATFFQQKRGQK